MPTDIVPWTGNPDEHKNNVEELLTSAELSRVKFAAGFGASYTDMARYAKLNVSEFKSWVIRGRKGGKLPEDVPYVKLSLEVDQARAQFRLNLMQHMYDAVEDDWRAALALMKISLDGKASEDLLDDDVVGEKSKKHPIEALAQRAKQAGVLLPDGTIVSLEKAKEFLNLSASKREGVVEPVKRRN